MKNIIDLVSLQFNSLFTLKKSLLIVLALSLFFIFVQPDMLTIAPLMYLMLATYSLTFYEEKSKFNYLVYTLPISTSEYILSKFIYSFINTIITVTFSGVLFTLVKLLGQSTLLTNIPMYSILLTVFAIGIFFMCIIIPATLLLGFEKGRYVMIFVALIPVMGSTYVFNWLPTIAENFNQTVLIILGIIASLIIILSSYFITNNAFSKKEIY